MRKQFKQLAEKHKKAFQETVLFVEGGAVGATGTIVFLNMSTSQNIFVSSLSIAVFIVSTFLADQQLKKWDVEPFNYLSAIGLGAALTSGSLILAQNLAHESDTDIAFDLDTASGNITEEIEFSAPDF